MIIDFIDEKNQLSIEEMETIEQLLQFAAKMEQIDDQAELSVSFVDDRQIQQMNKAYRGKDAATDVISFAMEEMGEGEMAITGADTPQVLGDIIISIDRAKEQSERFNHTMIRELGFLAVHGFLHLLGYDHMTTNEEQEMFQKQRDILDEYGLTR